MASDKETGRQNPESELLASEERVDLLNAITNHYPGGMHALRTNLGLWTPEQIEQKAKAFYAEKGPLTYKGLRSEHRSDLSKAIASVYPGGMVELRRKLGSEPKQNK